MHVDMGILIPAIRFSKTQFISSYFNFSKIMYLVLVHVSHLAKGEEKKVRTTTEKYEHLKARDLKHITRLHDELPCSSARKDGGVKAGVHVNRSEILKGNNC